MTQLLPLLLTVLLIPPFIVVLGNFARRPRPPEHLTPNCLLTRSPVVFVTGLRSPFYFRHYWNSLPLFLAEHGYDVEVLRLPWVDKEQRRAWARKLLNGKTCHLVMDSRTAEELADLFEGAQIHSLHIPSARGHTSWVLLPAELLHRWWLRRRTGVEPVPWAQLGLGTRSAMELLRFIRNEAEREWARAMDDESSQKDFEEESKA